MKSSYVLGLISASMVMLTMVGCGAKDEKTADKPSQNSLLSQQELSGLGTKVLKDTYKKYDNKRACWMTKGADKANYCMKVASVESVMTDDGEKVYVLATGQNVDGAKHEPVTGMVGMFAVKPENGNYTVIAQTQDMEVANDHVPSGTFIQLGKNIYGWQIEKNTVDQGQNIAGVTFYGVQDNQVKALGAVQTVYDDAVAEPDAKVHRTIRLEGAVTVDKTDKDATHYPLTVTVSGEKDGKKLSPKKYAIQFSAQKGQYVPPEDYPITD